MTQDLHLASFKGFRFLIDIVCVSSNLTGSTIGLSPFFLPFSPSATPVKPTPRKLCLFLKVGVKVWCYGGISIVGSYRLLTRIFCRPAPSLEL